MRTLNLDQKGSILAVEEVTTPKKDLRPTKQGRRRYKNCNHFRVKKAFSKGS
jgi:hypothetical protein